MTIPQYKMGNLLYLSFDHGRGLMLFNLRGYGCFFCLDSNWRLAFWGSMAAVNINEHGCIALRSSYRCEAFLGMSKNNRAVWFFEHRLSGVGSDPLLGDVQRVRCSLPVIPSQESKLKGGELPGDLEIFRRGWPVFIDRKPLQPLQIFMVKNTRFSGFSVDFPEINS